MGWRYGWVDFSICSVLLLFTGRHVFTADERFQILKPVEDHEQSLRPTLHQPNLTEWILQIQFVQQRDGGFYICQVYTHPRFFLSCLLFDFSLFFRCCKETLCYLQLNAKHSPSLRTALQFRSFLCLSLSLQSIL